jgi:transposase
MTKTQVEVITSVQRGRRWSQAEKERIVAAALEPGATILGVAREFGVHASQVFRWRQQLCSRVAAPGVRLHRGSDHGRAGRVSVPGAGADRGRAWDRSEDPDQRAADVATVTAVIAALNAGSR